MVVVFILSVSLACIMLAAGAIFDYNGKGYGTVMVWVSSFAVGFMAMHLWGEATRHEQCGPGQAFVVYDGDEFCANVEVKE